VRAQRSTHLLDPCGSAIVGFVLLLFQLGLDIKEPGAERAQQIALLCAGKE